MAEPRKKVEPRKAAEPFEAVASAESKTRNRVARQPARIMIVDDHPLVRRGLVSLIEGDPGLMVCGEAEDGPSAIEQIMASYPNLVTVDLSLKRGHGIELIKQIRAHDATIRTLVVSMHEESVYAERALHAGAMGYIDKLQSPEQILEAIHEVLAGNYYLSATMTRQLLQRVVDRSPCTGPLPPERLSDRELEVFELIGQGLTTRKIAEHLRLSVKTIDTYREHIKQKLDLRNGAALARRAVEWVVEHP